MRARTSSGRAVLVQRFTGFCLSKQIREAAGAIGARPLVLYFE